MVERRQRRADREPQLDRVFHALSAEPRRRIVELLREAEELRVTDLAEAFSMSLNGVSKHVKVLERAGLVRRRVQWREHWITVEWAGLDAAHRWVSFHRHFWSERLDALADHVAAEGETDTDKETER